MFLFVHCYTLARSQYVVNILASPPKIDEAHGRAMNLPRDPSKYPEGKKYEATRPPHLSPPVKKT